MSKQLAISAVFSVLAMAAFALSAGTANSAPAIAIEATVAKVSLPVGKANANPGASLLR